MVWPRPRVNGATTSVRPKRPNLFNESVIDKACEIGVEAWLSQLFNGLCLDLSDSFACHSKNCADFLQRIAISISKPKSEPKNFSFSIRKFIKNLS
jgi:hypothetical protein